MDRRVQPPALEGDVGAELGGAMAEQGHRGRLERWAPLVSLEQAVRAVAGEDRQLHVGRLAGRRGLAVVEVGVPVHEPETGVARKGLEHAEQERAVAADHQRAPSGTEDRLDTRGDRRRGPAHIGYSHHPRVRVAPRVADVGVEPARVVRLQALDEPGCAESGGGALLAAPGSRAVERRVDDGQLVHVLRYVPGLGWSGRSLPQDLG